jgi:hypothetical protein
MPEKSFVIINTTFRNGNPYFPRSALSYVLHVFSIVATWEIWEQNRIMEHKVISDNEIKFKLLFR